MKKAEKEDAHKSKLDGWKKENKGSGKRNIAAACLPPRLVQLKKVKKKKKI